MLYASSRYADPATTRDVMLVQAAGTQLRTLIRRPSLTGQVKVVTYVWRAGDRIDRISQTYLGDPSKWWQIMDINPELPNPMDIEPGTVLRIPRG